ncbi:MAG: ATP-binding cassette domain-containing protein [Chitinophagaceae bacterium]|nr:ATP-binding cassette domain-containing protein [Chitinophagaceae bacterium]
MHYASVENLTKSYGVRVLFKNIKLNIEEGDKIALVATNGSGKSTPLKILRPRTADSGTVWINKNSSSDVATGTNFDPQKNHLGQISFGWIITLW